MFRSFAHFYFRLSNGRINYAIALFLIKNSIQFDFGTRISGYLSVAFVIVMNIQRVVVATVISLALSVRGLKKKSLSIDGT